ncbi:Rne/Rng family ribonuclease [Georgenia muralis]|uniref:Ribonuclease E n=1 Tax=Georgenia muralis TaxID=154117 RepID=A0A3N4YYR8_9MICO|nr:Rne/Rng family ribonuclease [Georgenia muralis]RPF25623.1 ribonuclease E [Georgenia muralis]
MSDNDSTTPAETTTAEATGAEATEAPKRRTRSRRATAPAGAATTAEGATPEAGAPDEAAAAPAAKKAPARRSRAKTPPATTEGGDAGPAGQAPAEAPAADAPAADAGSTVAPAAEGEAPKKPRTRRASTRKTAEAVPPAGDAPVLAGDAPVLAGDAPVLAGDAPVPAGEAPVPAETADRSEAEPAPKKTRARRTIKKAASTDAATDAPSETIAGGQTSPAAETAETGSAPSAEVRSADAAPVGTATGSGAAETGVSETGVSGTDVAEDGAAGTGKRPARRSRRATAPARSPEQKIDVLAELGLGGPAAPADEPPTEETDEDEDDELALADETQNAAEVSDSGAEPAEGPRLPAAALLFQAPDTSRARPRRRASAPAGAPVPATERAERTQSETATAEAATTESEPAAEEPRGRRRGGRRKPAEQPVTEQPTAEDELPEETGGATEEPEEGAEDSGDEERGGRRRRRRGGRGRRNRGGQGESGGEDDEEPPTEDEPEEEPESGEDEGEEGGSSSRRRRRRRRSGRSGEAEEPRPARDEVTALKGSTRLEAKRQRRREGREAGRRRPTLSEAEFLARREAVDRKMIVREKDGLNQIAVLEDGILVEHYVARHTQTSMVGNVYLGRVQNVLPSMEAAFVDLGKGRNAVLYAGEVNWDAAGMEGQPRRIEQALKSGDTVLVQVTKDPIGHKGARLTSQITLAGRHLVLVPSGAMTGISRKLPENERARLKKLLKEIVPEGAGVIVRTAAEGASEEQLRADVERLTKQWADIESKAKNAKAAPLLLKGEPELAVRVVRDVFNEDFESLVVSGGGAWETISGYVRDLSPDLAHRMHHWTSERDVFAEHRVDEQLAKAMDRKVWLPSGGSLVIDRTEAMTVVDVNTGKFTGSGGTLEETVTRNNLEAAEEIVRQLRLRDIGGIIVIDFIDMVLESNRDLVMRRLLECLGRDRTRHQVAEVTSLGLVQMTRKRVGQGLVEAFSTPCEVCNGRGFVVHDAPVERSANGTAVEEAPPSARRRGGRKGSGGSQPEAAPEPKEQAEDPAAVAAREAVKATLATIAAAAASAHEHDHEHDTEHPRSESDSSGTGSTGKETELTARAIGEELGALRASAGAPSEVDGARSEQSAVAEVSAADVTTASVAEPAEAAEPAVESTGVIGAPAPAAAVTPASPGDVAADETPSAPAPRRARRSRRVVASGVVTPPSSTPEGQQQ